MSSKSKLILALLGATVIFTFNTGPITSVIRADEILPSESLALGLDSRAGLDALTGPSESDSVDPMLSGMKADNTELMPARTETVVNTDAAPGENPFVNQQLDLQPANQPHVVKASNPVAFAIENNVTPDAANRIDDIKAVNPFKVTTPGVDQTPEASQSADPRMKVDDSALRYYAASKDLKRLGAEMRRLKTLYPDWEPPKDLFSPVANVDEQPLWDVYSTGDYAAVRGRIAAMQSANPKWQPSDDLMNKLATGEARTLIGRAYAQKRWEQVISTAKATPSLLVCSDMQVLWQVGESFAQRRDYAQSFELYKYILTNCRAPELRLATVQKASLILPPQGLESLIAFGQILPDGTSEFEDIGFNPLRKQMGEFIQYTDFSSLPSVADMKRFVDFVQRKGSAEDAALIAWYFYAQQDWQVSNSWFLQAAQYERAPKYIEGVILTLRNLDRHEDALKVAKRYMRASPEITQQYVEIVAGSLTAEKPEVVLKDGELEVFEKVVLDSKSALGAQALGWKYLDDTDKEKAKSWFTDSVSWEPTEGGVVGLAVLASRAKNYGVLSSLKSKYAAEYASLNDFKIYSSKSYRSSKSAEDKKAQKDKKKRYLLDFLKNT